MKIFNKSKGFTLVEIVVVIGIMAVLTGVVLTSLSGAKSQNRDQQRVADVSNIQLALEMFFSHYRYYPTSLNALVPTYLPSVPKGPSSGEVYSYVPLVGIDAASTKCAQYHLWTTLETHSAALDGKKGFNSVNSSKCVSGQVGVSASSSPLIYDVISQ